MNIQIARFLNFGEKWNVVEGIPDQISGNLLDDKGGLVCLKMKTY